VDEPEWTRGEGQKGCGRRQAEQKKMKNFATNFQIWQTKTLSSAFEIGFEREL
jgi:hypothetical protein